MRTLDEGLRLKQQHIEEGVTVWREKQVTAAVACWLKRARSLKAKASEDI